MSTAERTLITLRPLFLGLAALTSMAWIVFWWTRRRAPRPASPASNDAGPLTSDL
jgi:hypothetical protein